MSPLFKLPTNFALYCGVCKQREKLGWVKKCGIDCGEETLSRCGRGKIRGKRKYKNKTEEKKKINCFAKNRSLLK